ncbi:hypothetical protein CK203_110692 [Vitis vinifera]|uniref:Uncharacterized protein n=1 Tax=Vitis vinifera TaxID=29760 RepID=A0A438DH20_VITVI|nr:hypothetical protein CK203_110692 [Vitis vinifera]
MQPIDGIASFSPQDLARVTVPHEDALVLSLKIVGFQVCWVLVDPGSSTNLLHISTYKQMGIPFSTLGSPSRVLIGFNGLTTWSLGEIVFPVEADPTNLNVHFSIGSDPLPYNAILRRAWIHKMKATPSTYHQKVSFLTKARQVDLFGSQLTARQCYQVNVMLAGEEIENTCTDNEP